jgi:hypothetical protein
MGNGIGGTGSGGCVLELFLFCITFQLLMRLGEQFFLGSYLLVTLLILTLGIIIPRMLAISFRWSGPFQTTAQDIVRPFHQEF